MKSITKPATSKLVAKFDNDLMQILMADLQNFKANNPTYGINKQAAAKQSLKAA
jgi:hypothetical protein